MPAVDVTLGSFQFRDFRWVRFGGAGADPVQQLHEEAHQAGTGPPVLYLGCSVGFLLLLADFFEVEPPFVPVTACLCNSQTPERSLELLNAAFQQL